MFYCIPCIRSRHLHSILVAIIYFNHSSHSLSPMRTHQVLAFFSLFLLLLSGHQKKSYFDFKTQQNANKIECDWKQQTIVLNISFHFRLEFFFLCSCLTNLFFSFFACCSSLTIWSSHERTHDSSSLTQPVQTIEFINMKWTATK